jgi:hypothetical protein
MHSSVKTLFGTATAFALCVSPTMSAAATAVQPASPLVAVSVFGTQASAQIVCSQGASGAAAAGAAAAAQGQAGCVLPATDLPPPVSQGAVPPPPPSGGGIGGAGWILAGLDALLVIAGLATLIDDDDDDDDDEVSPS